MPYIKPKEKPYGRMVRLLKGYDLTGRRLAEVLGVAPSTAYSRLERPETLTLGELDRIVRVGHVPLEEIRAAISK